MMGFAERRLIRPGWPKACVAGSRRQGRAAKAVAFGHP
jgi:hypothetical protein